MAFTQRNRAAQSKLDVLRRVPAFAGCTDRELHEIARHVDDWTVEAGTVLTSEGSHGQEAFLIVDGRATVSVGGVVIDELGPGSFAGEMALMDHGPRSATVVAATAMHLLVIGPAAFDDFASHGVVARKLAKELASRVRRADAKVVPAAD